MTELIQMRTPDGDERRLYRRVTAQIVDRGPDGSPQRLLLLDDGEFDFDEYVELLKILVPESQFKSC